MKGMCILFCLLLTVAVATPVAQASTLPRDTRLSDSQQPGSVLVFPIFRTGSQTTTDLGTVPNTAFEISVVCPPNQTEFTCGGNSVLLHAEWVCAGSATTSCAESDFEFATTVDGTVRFNPSNLAPFTTHVAPPPCNQGYLIVWAIRSDHKPIKFDGLIGDAVLRESPGSATAYDAIPIQADPALATGALTVDPTENPPELHFDGAPGHYLAVTGQIYGSVRYPSTTTTSDVRTSLVLLTLDVDSNLTNAQTFVPLNFFDEAEDVFSTSTTFYCWERDTKVVPQGATAFPVVATKGAVISAQASENGDERTRTILGLIITQEKKPAGGPSGGLIYREYAYPFYNNSVEVDTEFEYNPGGFAK